MDAFPGAQLVACDQQVVDDARAQTTPKVMANWKSGFPGQISQSHTVPALTDSQEFDLQGHPVLFHTIGGADGVLATIAHVPDTQTICSGDIAYNNIHMWLRGSTPDTRKTWLASLDAVAALEPSTIITGHKDPDAPDDNAIRVLDQSRRYIEDSTTQWPSPARRLRSSTSCSRSTPPTATGTRCSPRLPPSSHPSRSGT